MTLPAWKFEYGSPATSQFPESATEVPNFLRLLSSTGKSFVENLTVEMICRVGADVEGERDGRPVASDGSALGDDDGASTSSEGTVVGVSVSIHSLTVDCVMNNS